MYMTYDTRLQKLEESTIKDSSRDYSILRSLQAEHEAGNLTSGSPLEGELIRLENTYLAKTELSIFRSLIPEATIEKVTFETIKSGDNQGGMLVKVVYSISDVVEGDAISQWFDQMEYEKYFIVETKLYEMEMKQYGSETFQTFKSIRSDTNLAALSAAPNEQEQGLGIVLSRNTDESVTKFVFEKTYELDKEPSGLDFEVITSFDVVQLERDFGIQFSFSRADLRTTKKAMIMDHGKLQYPVQDFRLREQMTQKFSLTGEDGELTERGQAFSFVASQVNTRRKIKRQGAADFFSDIWITRSAQGEAKFVFVFNPDSFFSKISEYRDIYKKLPVEHRRRLREDIYIPSLKVKRKRVRVTHDKNGSSVIDFSDKLDMQEIVETHKKKGQSSFSRVKKNTGSIMQLKLSGVSGESLMFMTGSDYSTADLTDGKYCYGVRIEVVDTLRDFLLEMLKVFREKITLMKRIYRASLSQEYYKPETDMYKISFAGILDDINTKQEELVKTFGESYIDVRIDKSQYSDISVDFIETFETFIKPYVTAPRGSRPTDNRRRRRALRAMVRRHELSEERRRNIRNLFSIDAVKSPKEVEMIIEIMERLLSNSLSIIGETPSSNPDRISSSLTDKKVVSEVFYTQTEKVFDANVPKLEGMEYLTNFSETAPDEAMREISTLAGEAGEIGIRVIDGAYWEGRILDEVNKFFPLGTTEVIVPSSTGSESAISISGNGSQYFSPSALITRTHSPDGHIPYLGMNDNNSDYQFGRVATLDADNMRALGENVLAPIPYEVSNRPEVTWLSGYNISFGNSEKEKTKIEQDSERLDYNSQLGRSPDPEAIDYNIYSDSHLVQETFERQVEQQQFEQYIFSRVSKYHAPGEGFRKKPKDNLTINTSFVSETALWNLMPEQVRRQEIDEAPNQVIAGGLYMPEELGVSVVSSEFLTKVQYLSGFSRDEEDLNVRIPVWEDLTVDVYRQNQNQNLLCRISPFQRTRLGIRTSSNGKPIYDAVFIIAATGDYYEEPESMVEDILEVARERAEARRQELLQALTVMFQRKLDLKQTQRQLQLRYYNEYILPASNIVWQDTNYHRDAHYQLFLRDYRIWERTYRNNHREMSNRAFEFHQDTFEYQYTRRSEIISIGQHLLNDRGRDNGWYSPRNTVLMMESAAEPIMNEISEIENELSFTPSSLNKRLDMMLETAQNEGYTVRMDVGPNNKAIVEVEWSSGS